MAETSPPSHALDENGREQQPSVPRKTLLIQALDTHWSLTQAGSRQMVPNTAIQRHHPRSVQLCSSGAMGRHELPRCWRSPRALPR
jgi:hypothetical protein